MMDWLVLNASAFFRGIFIASRFFCEDMTDRE